MDLEDITAVMKLCDDNVHKLQDSLQSYQREVDHVRQVLAERWVNVEKVDGRLIALHDQLLSSLSEVNAYVIKMNLHIKLNRPGGGMLRESEKPEEPPYRRNSVKLSGRNAIEESGKHKKDEEKPPNRANVQQLPEDSKQQLVPIDLSSTHKFTAEEIPNRDTETEDRPNPNSSLVFSMHSSWVIEPTPEKLKPKPRQQALPQASTTPSLEKPTSKSTAPPEATTISRLPAATLPKFPIPARKRPLLPPKSGTQMSSDGIYTQIFKNIDAFPANTVVTATLMHLNIATNCIFVAKWDKGSQPLQKLLQGQVPLREMDQMPDYGDIFAVYDSSDPIIPRVTVSAISEDGGYDAYLIDYGEHIHLGGKENIFALPDPIKQLPAEAIRCHLANYNVSNMKMNRYEPVKLLVLDNNGVDIVADLLKDDQAAKTVTPKDKTDGKSCPEKSAPAKLSEADMAMLNEIGPSTSDPLKAVLGFRPKDEQRICRHYDPKINGCFKGNTCRLIHEPFAPLGATKDVEVAAPLPEAVFDTPVPHKMGSTVRMLITFVNSPIEVYAQFVDEATAPLVWDNKDVPAHKRTFKRKPCILDIVLAHYTDDCFYRAQIIDEQDGEYQIFYVDYGNTEFVYINSLAPCDDIERLKPHRAISCHIEGVIRMPDLCHRKNAECVEYLKTKLLNVELDVVLRHRLPDGFLVGFTGEYADVPRQLVQRGYAQPSD
ncbi:hypothetical protein KR054_006809, partial [Drosophila jambulina]